MKIYAMFVRLSSYDLNGGWRLEGFTVNEHDVQSFITNVNKDIEESRSNTVLTKTLAYHVTELNI